MSVLHEVVESSFCISVEYRPLGLYHFSQFLSVGRQTGYIISLLFHTKQKIVKGRYYFHAGSGQCVLTGTFVIIDSYFLLKIRFCFQIQVVVYCRYKSLQTFGDGIRMAQSFFIFILCEKGERADSSVYFRCYDAL